MASSFSNASVKLWRSMVKADWSKSDQYPNIHGCHRSFATFTAPKFAPVAAADAAAHHHVPAHQTAKARGKLAANTAEWIPIYMLLGFLTVAISVGIHTAKQQLCHSPAVQVSKKKREMVPEVDNPYAILTSSGKFIDKSFLRKVAHIQDSPNRLLPDSLAHGNLREVESLESAGVAFGGRRG